MQIKNTYKSKIIEKKIDLEIYFASIHNKTLKTDTIQKQINKSFIQFYFCLEGKVSFQFMNLQTSILEQNNSFMVFNKSENIPLNLNFSSGSKLAILVVSHKKMTNLFNNNNLEINQFLKSFEENMIQKVPISLNIKYIISQMEYYNLKQEFEKFYLSGKMYELLINYFSEKDNNFNDFRLILDEEMALKIKEVANILKTNFADVPKIINLSKQVNIPEYKLQECFKKIYNQTIYNFYMHHKLEYAKNKLLTTNKKIKDIAQEVGYYNVSHFIDAFRNKYNSTPKQLIMKLKQ